MNTRKSIEDEGRYFEAEIVTKNNNSLADMIIVEKNTGWMRSAYYHEQDHGWKRVLLLILRSQPRFLWRMRRVFVR
jgi:hypothetical protein